MFESLEESYCQNPVKHRVKIAVDTKSLFHFTDDRERNILVCQACLKELEALPKPEKKQYIFNDAEEIKAGFKGYNKKPAETLKQTIKTALNVNLCLNLSNVESRLFVSRTMTKLLLNSMKDVMRAKFKSPDGRLVYYYFLEKNRVKIMSVKKQMKSEVKEA